MTLIKRGSQGQLVRGLQTTLNALGAGGDALTVDGIFGAKTEAAVKAFQASVGLADDGIVGRLSSFALLRQLGQQIQATSRPPARRAIRLRRA